MGDMLGPSQPTRIVARATALLLAGPGLIVAKMEPTEENVIVGCYVKLRSNASEFQRAFDNCEYCWDDSMTTILGKEVCVLDRPQPGIFGLSECIHNSGQPIWWYPFSVIESVKMSRQENEVKPRTVREFLASLGLENEVLSKATEILGSEGVTVEQLETVVDDEDLQEIGIEKAAIEAIRLHRQSLQLEIAAEVERQRPPLDT
jgi:hypothetical protein